MNRDGETIHSLGTGIIAGLASTVDLGGNAASATDTQVTSNDSQTVGQQRSFAVRAGATYTVTKYLGVVTGPAATRAQRAPAARAGQDPAGQPLRPACLHRRDNWTTAARVRGKTQGIQDDLAFRPVRARYVRIRSPRLLTAPRPCWRKSLRPRPALLRKLRDELTDAVNYLEVRLFAAPGSPVLGMSDSARFPYIGHRPCTRASGKADEVLTFVIHPLIHADDDVGPGQARRSQLVAITRLSKFPDAILRKKLKCCSVRSQVSGPIHRGRGPARYSPQVLELE